MVIHIFVIHRYALAHAQLWVLFFHVVENQGGIVSKGWGVRCKIFYEKYRLLRKIVSFLFLMQEGGLAGW